MKKILMLLFLVFSSIALVACGDKVKLEWVKMPDSVYQKGTMTEDQFNESISVKIGEDTYTIAKALEVFPKDFKIVSPFNNSSVGDKVFTVKYKTLTLNFNYKVVEGTPDVDTIKPSYDWYDGKTSPYTLSSIEDLYGFANIVNGKDGKTAYDFAGKTVKLGKNIDLTEKIWTPIGEGARKDIDDVSYEDLPHDDVRKRFEYTNETELISALNEHVSDEKDFESYIFLYSSYFAQKEQDAYKYYFSGSSGATGHSFSGTFDGQGYTITGLSDIGYTPLTTLIYANSEKVIKGYVFGFFGIVSGDVTVKDLTFEDVQINGAYYDTNDSNLILAEIDSVGAAIGYAYGDGDLLIDNIKVLSGSISGEDAIGGIVGRAYNIGEMTFKNSENRANITSNGHAGGMVAYLTNQTPTVLFENNTNYGNIANIGSSKYAGSMFSYHGKTGVTTIKDSRNFGNISGMMYDTLDKTSNGMTSGYKANTWYNETGCQNYGTLTKK